MEIWGSSQKSWPSRQRVRSCLGILVLQSTLVILLKLIPRSQLDDCDLPSDSQPWLLFRIAQEHLKNTDAWAPPQVHYTRISGGRAWELCLLTIPRQFWHIAWVKKILARHGLSMLKLAFSCTQGDHGVYLQFKVFNFKQLTILWLWYNYTHFIGEKSEAQKNCTNNLRSYILWMLEPVLDSGAKDLFYYILLSPSRERCYRKNKNKFDSVLKFKWTDAQNAFI